MGYYTCFTLEIKTADNLGTHPDDIAIIAKLRETNEMAEYALDETGYSHNDTKWYDHAEQLREFSKLYRRHFLSFTGTERVLMTSGTSISKAERCKVPRSVWSTTSSMS
jgi:hypothetical protein